MFHLVPLQSPRWLATSCGRPPIPIHIHVTSLALHLSTCLSIHPFYFICFSFSFIDLISFFSTISPFACMSSAPVLFHNFVSTRFPTQLVPLADCFHVPRCMVFQFVLVQLSINKANARNRAAQDWRTPFMTRSSRKLSNSETSSEASIWPMGKYVSKQNDEKHLWLVCFNL